MTGRDRERANTALVFVIYLCAGIGAALLFDRGHTGPGILVISLFVAAAVFFAVGAFEQ